MREEIVFQWSIKWAGRWRTTNQKCTEESIRKEHPEAVCLELTRETKRVLETDAELRLHGNYGVMNP